MDEKKLDERKIVELSVDDILPNRFQPRIKFDDSTIFELSESIKVHGVFQPIIVRPIGDKYEIIAGERRYKASVLAGKTTVPAIIMNINDSDTVEIALIENVQRANLTPIEEAISYKKILDMGYINQESLAQKLGKTQSTIANKLRLLNLDDEVQEALLENKISERHARSLLKLKDFQDQRNMLEKIISERLTVRKTDEEISKMIDNEQSNNPFNNIINVPAEENTGVNPFNSAINALPAEMNTNNNANPMNDFNAVNNFAPQSQILVPDQPIYNIGDVNNQVFNPSSFDTGVINSSVISSNASNTDFNPDSVSMMDVNTIEKTAQDLNVIKPIAPMENFLMGNSQPASSTPSMSQESDAGSDDANSLLKPGKFFNFPQEVEEKPVPIDYNTSKNFNFDSLYNNQIVQPTQTNIDVTAIDNTTTPLVGNINDSNVNPITDFNMPTTINPNTMLEPTNSFGMESTTPVGGTPSNSDVSQSPFSNFNFTSVSTPNDTLQDNNTYQPNTFPANIQDTAISYNEGSVQTPEINSEQNSNMESALTIIRNAVESVKSYGFNTVVKETEEPNLYRVIIDINK